MSIYSVKMATTTMSVGESSLVSQYLSLCQALASMGLTISFSLTLGSTFYFNPEVPIKETTIVRVHNEAPGIPVGNKDELHA